MRFSRPLSAALAASIGCGALDLASGGCSSHDAGSPPLDGAIEAPADADATDAKVPADGGMSEGSDADASAIDASAIVEASSPFVTGMRIVTTTGAALQGAPGAAIPLAVRAQMSDGTTMPVSPDQVTWLAPSTLVAEDPSAPGIKIVPEAGAQAIAFFVRNDFNDENPGVLYLIDPGAGADTTLTVSASVADAGEISATVIVLAALLGDAASGEALFLHGPECGTCHGATGGGSPPALLPDGGPVLLDGGPAYSISGQLYPYPAPGLNNAPDSGNVASDPAWNAALLGMAAQADIDNRGVALRKPMPDWFGGTNGSGGTLSAQDFADIYAWLKTQTQ